MFKKDIDKLKDDKRGSVGR